MHTIHIPRRFVRSDWGGTETVILESSKRLLARGHEAVVMCPAALAEACNECIEGLRVRRYPYFYPYLGLGAAAREQLDRVGGNLFSFSLMRALRKMREVDVFHLHTMGRLGGIVRKVAREQGTPYVVSLHGGMFDMPREQAASLAAPTQGSVEWGKALGWWVGSRRVLPDAAAIICVGHGESELAQEHFPDKRVVYLPHGVDVERFAQGNGAAFRQREGIAPDEEVLLTVGRIGTQKNQILAVRALPELLRRTPRLRLVLIGPVSSKAYLEQIESEASAAGGEKHLVIIPGLPQGDVRLLDAYKAADAFLLPSLHEPFGIVILEAWAAGLPVLASRVGGIPRFVEDGSNGVLFTSDSVEGLVRAYDALHQNGEAFARAGREKVEREYSWDRAADQLLTLYSEVIADSS